MLACKSAQLLLQQTEIRCAPQNLIYIYIDSNLIVEISGKKMKISKKDYSNYNNRDEREREREKHEKS